MIASLLHAAHWLRSAASLVPLALAVLGVLAFAGAGDASAQQADQPANDEKDNPVVVIKTSMGDIHVELFPQAAPKTVANFVGLAEGTKEWTDPASGEKVTKPFYDGLTFHRVIEDFMIQGGCPKGEGTGGPGYTFADEINANDLGLDEIKAMDFEKGQPHPWLGIRSQQQYQMQIVMPLLKKLGIDSQEELTKREQEVQKALRELTLKDVYENMGYEYNPDLKSYPPKRGALAMANSGPNTNGSQFFINVVDTPWLTGKHTVFGRVVEGMDVVDKISKVKTNQSGQPAEPVKIISIRKKEG